MQQYLDLVRIIRDKGTVKGDRTGTGTKSIFGHQMRFNLSDGFPIVTAKKTHLKSVIHELLWFLKGSTNIRYLKENGVRIWDEWVKPGTEEYEALSCADIQAALAKHFNCPDFTPVMSEELVGTTEYRIIRDEDDNDRIVFEHGSEGSYARAYEEIIGKPARKLIAGELGPVYGSQWRSWPNPQIMLHENIDPALSATDLFGKTEKLSPNNAVPQVLVIKHEESPVANQYAADEKRRYMGAGMTYGEWLAEGRATAFVKHETIDQIANLIEMLKKNPDSRRLIVSAWNPAEVDNMALPPCHTMFQFYTEELTSDERGRIYNTLDLDTMMAAAGIIECRDDVICDELTGRITKEESAKRISQIYDDLGIPRRRLSCQLYQRSADVFLGVPFNIASYALLVMMVAQVVDMVPGDFIWTGGDCHLYNNHAEQVEELLSRETFPLPTMKINPEVKDIFDFKFEDFELVGYQSGSVISAPVAV